MSNDHALKELKLSVEVIGKLEDLAIRSVRQLFARMRREGPGLQVYLDLTDGEFADIYQRVKDVIQRSFPDDLQPKAHPEVNKAGVPMRR